MPKKHEVVCLKKLNSIWHCQECELYDDCIEAFKKYQIVKAERTQNKYNNDMLEIEEIFNKMDEIEEESGEISGDTFNK